MHPIENKFLQIRALAQHLPQAVNIFAYQLLGAAEQLADDHQHLLKAMMHLAESMEQQGAQQASLQQEPNYHNRQHALEVLSAMILLLDQADTPAYLAQPSEAWPDFSQHEKLLLLIAALGHDFCHPGGINQSSAQFEQIAAQRVAEILQINHIVKNDIDFIKNLILATEFCHVPALHASLSDFANKPIPLALRASIVLTEADILPSVLPEHGLQLAQQLSQEWQISGVINALDPATKQNHQRFLSTVRFSSPYAIQLGMPDLIRSQLIS